MRGVLVLAEDLEVMWPLAVPYIEMALARANNEVGIDDVHERIATGMMSLWMAIDQDFKVHGACTIQCYEYPKKKQAMLTHMGGDWACIQVLPEIKAWLKDHEFDSIMIWGRKGWERALKDYGFDYRYTCIEAEL